MRATLTRALVSPRVVLGGLFALSLLAFLALIPAPRVDGQLIGSDGVSYYVFLRSAMIDGDLEFRNEFAYACSSAQCGSGVWPSQRCWSEITIERLLLPVRLLEQLLR